MSRTPTADLSPGRVVVAAALIGFLGYVLAVALFVVVYPLGNSYPDDAAACQVAAAESAPPGVRVDETTPVTASRSWFPPRIVCAVDVQRDGKPVITVHDSPGAGAVALAAVALILAICAWLVRALRRELRASVSRGAPEPTG